MLAIPSATPDGESSPMSAEGPIASLIQARLSSSRLPGKSLLPLGGRTVLDHVIDRAAAFSAQVVVCTSTDPRGRMFNFFPIVVLPLPSAAWQAAHFALYRSGPPANTVTGTRRASAARREIRGFFKTNYSFRCPECPIRYTIARAERCRKTVRWDVPVIPPRWRPDSGGRGARGCSPARAVQRTTRRYRC